MQLESRIPITFGITGHRDVDPADLWHARQVLKRLFVRYAEDYEHTPLRLLSPCAEGADRLAADVFLELRREWRDAGREIAHAWELYAVLPLLQQEYEKDFPASVDEFRKLLAEADHVAVLPAARSPEGTARDACYEAAGTHVARHSNVLVAIWDGKDNGLRGGTSAIVRANLQGSKAGAGIEDHEVGPVFHVKVRRCADGGAGSTSESSEGMLLLPDARLWPSLDLQVTLRKFDQYNAHLKNSAGSDSQDFQEHLQQSRRNLSPDFDQTVWPAMTFPERRMVGIYAGLDTLALELDARRKRLVALMFLLAGGGLVALWAALEGVLEFQLFFAYLGLIALSFHTYRKLKGSDLESQWHYRMFAECLRVQFFRTFGANKSGKESGSGSAPVTDSFLRQHLVESGWVREGLQVATFNPDESTAESQKLRRNVVKSWVRDQLAYFVKKGRDHEAKSKAVRWISLLLTSIGAASIGALIATDFFLSGLGLLHSLCSWSAGAGPGLALLAQGYADIMAYEPQAKNYRRMREVFDYSDNALERAESDNEVDAAIFRTGEESIAEAVNWLMLRKSREIKPITT